MILFNLFLYIFQIWNKLFKNIKEFWSNKVRKEVAELIEKYKKLPFITKMMDGTFSIEPFGKNIGQDSFYCEKYSKSLKILSNRFEFISEEYFRTFKNSQIVV